MKTKKDYESRPKAKAMVSCQMIWLDKAKAVVNSWKGSLATLQNVVTSSDLGWRAETPTAVMINKTHEKCSPLVGEHMW